MLHWKIMARSGATHVLLYGEINEVAGFGELKLLRGRVSLDFAGVKRINSMGVRELLDFLDSLRASATVEAERCSPAMVAQLNMLPELARRITVRSVLAPLECPRCLTEAEVPVRVSSSGGALPHTTCDECGTEMALAEPEDRFFAFLSEGASS